MAIPTNIKIKESSLPPRPGVYFMKDKTGKIMYVGKATSLRTRVSSYFVRPADERIAKMVAKISAIDWEETSTVVEALILESKYIKKLQPPYNIREKDDKSRIYLAFTRADYPRPVLIREHELVRTPKKQFLQVFGPFKSSGSVQSALDALRKAFPWSTCKPGHGRACFYVHLKQCPGVCSGTISSAEYKKIINGLMKYFAGKKVEVIRSLKRRMQQASDKQDYETAKKYRDRLWALEHIRDIAIMKRDDVDLHQFIDVYGRVEGYDISNISGTDAVGSMVVFIDGKPKKSEYKKFKIKTVHGPNDVAMMKEMLQRRFKRELEPKWSLPNLLVIDGGKGQINVAQTVLKEYGLNIPIIGIAKGPDRKQDELIYDKKDLELTRLVHAFKPLLLQVRDEAHRFAVSYHRKLRNQRLTKNKK